MSLIAWDDTRRSTCMSLRSKHCSVQIVPYWFAVPICFVWSYRISLRILDVFAPFVTGCPRNWSLLWSEHRYSSPSKHRKGRDGLIWRLRLAIWSPWVSIESPQAYHRYQLWIYRSSRLAPVGFSLLQQAVCATRTWRIHQSIERFQCKDRIQLIRIQLIVPSVKAGEVPLVDRAAGQSYWVSGTGSLQSCSVWVFRDTTVGLGSSMSR